MDNNSLILIVDDVEANRLVLKDIITEMEYKPVLASSAMQALKFVEHQKPALIILDIAMPQMDGYECCKLLKDNPETRNIPIIFISAFDEPKDIVKGLELGGADYVTKPFIREVVKARVGLHLSLASTRNDMMELNKKLHVSLTDQLHQMQEEKKKILYALTRVARENACYDVNHMERVSEDCKILAEAMQLSPVFSDVISDMYIENIGIAAPLCDIGNMSIPTEILRKKDSLNEEETKTMQTHTTLGARILRDVKELDVNNDFMQMAVDIANYHHENWDGSGYPKGLSGNDIPLAAQIVSIVSSYCALTELRCHREPYDKDTTLEQLETEAGNKFNPEIFAILSKIYRQLR